MCRSNHPYRFPRWIPVRDRRARGTEIAAGRVIEALANAESSNDDLQTGHRRIVSHHIVDVPPLCGRPWYGVRRIRKRI